LSQFDSPPGSPSDAETTAPAPILADSASNSRISTAHSHSESDRGASSEGDFESTALDRTALDDRGIRRALMRIAHEIVERTEDTERLYLVAIPNGGVPLGRILVENIESLTDLRPPLGILDTTLYRDDLSTLGSRPRLRRTEMPSSVDDRVVILVEDVVSTGRTIRAAMDALMDFGRPSHVRVVALIDRGHRELPIKIDFVGKNIPTRPNEKVIFRAEPIDEKSTAGKSAVGVLQVIVRGGRDS